MHVLASWLFGFLTHLLIVAGAILLGYLTLRITWQAPSTDERNVRLIALLSGFLAFAGSRAVGLDVPELLFSAIGTTRPFSFGLVEVLFPALTGAFTAWFLLRAFNKKNETRYAYRLMILVTTFLLMLFSDVYASGFGRQPGLSLNPHLLPNLSFALGLSLYIIVYYRRDEPEDSGDWRRHV